MFLLVFSWYLKLFTGKWMWLFTHSTCSPFCALPSSCSVFHWCNSYMARMYHTTCIHTSMQVHKHLNSQMFISLYDAWFFTVQWHHIESFYIFLYFCNKNSIATLLSDSVIYKAAHNIVDWKLRIIKLVKKILFAAKVSLQFSPFWKYIWFSCIL